MLTPGKARAKLKVLLTAIGLKAEDYGTHSLRRSGASYLLAKGVPLEMIKVMGDWSPNSSCVFRYLRPGPEDKLQVLLSANR